MPLIPFSAGWMTRFKGVRLRGGRIRSVRTRPLLGVADTPPPPKQSETEALCQTPAPQRGGGSEAKNKFVYRKSASNFRPL